MIAADRSLPEAAQELALLVDLLIPGDGDFPAASQVGAHGLLADRLRERVGLDAISRLLTTLVAASAGRTLGELPDDERAAAVQRWQEAEPTFFTVMLNTLYYSYYQHPLVVEAIRGLGITYNDAPQPQGYVMPPYDPTPGIGVPTERRGFYFTTEGERR